MMRAEMRVEITRVGWLDSRGEGGGAERQSRHSSGSGPFTPVHTPHTPYSHPIHALFTLQWMRGAGREGGVAAHTWAHSGEFVCAYTRKLVSRIMHPDPADGAAAAPTPAGGAVVALRDAAAPDSRCCERGVE